MMTLLGLAIAVAYVYSAAVTLGLAGKVFYWELATLVDVMLLGHWLEMRSMLGASGAVEELVELTPDEAHRVADDSSIEDVPVSELSVGERVRIKPGERLPADGEVVDGESQVDDSMLTGESKPVNKSAGDEVVGGSVNGQSSLTVEVSQTGEEGYLAKVVDMVRTAQASRSRTQDVANRAAFWLTLAAITAGGVTLAAWLATGHPFDYSLERMVTVMVITCPHALGLAIPLVVAVSTGLAAKRGLLIRDRAAFERARDIDTVVFDKTGTLTEGVFAVSRIEPFGETDADEILRLAAAVEAHSEHAIAAGILEHAKNEEIDVPSAEDFGALTGKGVEARVDGTRIRVLSPNAARDLDLGTDGDRLEELGRGGRTVVVVVRDDEALGAVALGDEIRPEAREALEGLDERGIRTVMITGDSHAAAEAVAEELGMDDFLAEVLPDQKADESQKLRRDGRRVAMVGDGINDAPALAATDLGVAIGAGTDVAAETADVVLVRSDPRDVVGIVSLAEATHAKMVQNLWRAAGYNILAVPLAAGVLAPVGFVLPPAVGAVVMSASTIIVAANAVLLDRESSGDYAVEGGSQEDLAPA